QPDEGRAGRHRRQGPADPCLQRGAVQPGDQEGRSRGRESARRRQEGARVQGQRRAGGRVMAKKDEAKHDKPEKKPAQQQAPKQPKKEAAKKEAAAPRVASGPQEPAPPARLASYYKDKVVPDLMQKFGYKTVMQVPRIKKITINMGVGE